MVSWTDGHFFALMWPDLPELVRCPHCGALLWISDQELLGDRENGALEGDRHDGRGGATSFLERRRRREELAGAETCWMPEEDDYYDLLGRGGLSRRRERYLRLKAWRLGNDARRECAEMPRGMVLKKKDPIPPLCPRETANLEALARIFNTRDPEQRLLKAEVFRELGRFKAAARLLEKPFTEELREVADFMKMLIIKEDVLVREIKLDPTP